MVQNQHLNVFYKFQSPFIEYAFYTCEWSIHGNLCKHQFFVILRNIDLIKENIIEYCGTWFGSNHGGFQVMFTNSKYLQLGDGASNDEGHEDIQVEELGIIDIDGLMTTNVNIFNTNDILNIINELESSLAPMEKMQFKISPMNAKVVESNYVTIPHHYQKMLHQISKTFNLFKPMNHFTHIWSFTLWMMANSLQLIE
jgi:hypothetical protein